MLNQVLPQLVAAILLLATPVVLEQGFPAVDRLTKTLSTLLGRLRIERPKRRQYSTAPWGARGWWE